MSFLLPLGLLGLLTLPIILLLHLFRNRREPLVVSSLRLWRGLHQKRQGMRPRTIPLSLLLLAQLLIAAALTFALAQPVFSFLRNRPQHTIFILDNTVSMAATDTASTGGAASRFEAAREFIHTRLQEMGEKDTFVLITLNRHPELLFSGDNEQQPQARQILDNLVPGGTGVDLPAALTLANGLIEPGEQYNQITVLTDNNYEIDAEDLPQVYAPLEWQTFGTSASSAPSNQALVNVAARTQLDKSYRLFVRVVNYGDEAVNRTLQLSVDGQVADDSAVQLDPQGEAVRVWTIPAAAQTATVEIVEEDVLPLDNRADLMLANTTSYRTLLLIDKTQSPEAAAETTDVEAVTIPGEEDAPPLVRALEVQTSLDLTIDDAANLGDYNLDEYDLIVFDGLPLNLTEWPAGDLLLINPPLGHPLLTVENFARNLRPDPETASSLLDGIDLSGVYFNRLPQVTLPDWAEVDLMAVPFSDEATVGLPAQPQETYPLIFHGTVAESRVVVWAFDLEASNLSGRLALPLLTDNTLASLLSNSLPPVVPVGEPVTIGQDLSVELPDGLRLSPSAQTGVGLSRRFTQTQQAGIYRLFNENNNLVGGFATQAGSSFESNLSNQFDPTVIVSVETGAGDASPEVEFTEYWPWLAGLALVVITLEGWLAWRK